MAKMSNGTVGWIAANTPLRGNLASVIFTLITCSFEIRSHKEQTAIICSNSFPRISAKKPFHRRALGATTTTAINFGRRKA